MPSGRTSRAQRTEDASRGLPGKRGEKVCAHEHNTFMIKDGASCPECKAVK